MNIMLSALGDFLNRRRWTVLAASLVVMVVAAAYGLGVFAQLSTDGQADFAAQGAQATEAREVISAKFGDLESDAIILLTGKDDSRVGNEAFRTEAIHLIDIVQGYDVQVSSFYNTGSGQFVSEDSQSTFLALKFDGDKERQLEQLESIRQDITSDTLDVRVGGELALNQEINEQVESDLAKAETISFIALAILLVIVFRSFVAGFLPLLLGGVGIVGALALTRLLTELTPVSQYAINVIILLGLGLAIDYSLFIVGRFREEFRKVHLVQPALVRTMQTAGRTVFFSGLIVIISLLGMVVFPLTFLRSMALGGSMAVLASMVGALIILPAILATLGHRVNWLSFGSARRDLQAFRQKSAVHEKESIWHRFGRIVMRHDKLSISLALSVLLLIALPVLGIHFASPDYRTLPEGRESRVVAESLTNDFGNQLNVMEAVYTVDSGSIYDSGSIGDLYDFVQELEDHPQVRSVESIVSFDGSLDKRSYQQLLASRPIQNERINKVVESRMADNTTLLTIRHHSDADDSATQNLVQDVRTMPTSTNAKILVGGEAAGLHDLLETLVKYLPYGLAIIVIAILVLMFLMLGSVVIPLKAMLMNVLALGASFGFLVWVFQAGYLTDWLNLTHVGNIDATMPVLIFAIAFGLSMDYSVFLYSRVKEQYDSNGGDNNEAVLMGLQKTGPIITSAAVLLFVVVAAFATSRIPLLQQVGVGLAVTVLLDAFLIRMVLVPATMKVLGRWNWWAPAPLARLQKRLNLAEKD